MHKRVRDIKESHRRQLNDIVNKIVFFEYKWKNGKHLFGYEIEMNFGPEARDLSPSERETEKT